MRRLGDNIDRAGLVAAVEQAVDAIVITDLTGTIQYVNPAFTAISGYSGGEAVGQNPRVLSSGQHPAEFYKNLWRTVQSGQVWEGEIINRRKNGTLYHEEMRITPVRNADGEIVSYVAVKHDVTERRAAEESRRLLASIVETSGDAIVAATLDGIILTWNRGAESVLGYSAAEAIGKHVAFLMDPDRLTNLQYFMQTISGGSTVSQYESVCRHKDGRAVHVAVSGSPLRNSTGEVVALSAILRDISPRKRAEEALKESEERFRIMADGCPEPMWVTDAKGGVQLINRACREFFGKPFEEVQGDLWRLLIHPDDLAGYTKARTDSLLEQKAYRWEARVRRTDGEWRWAASYAEPRFSRSGEFLGHVGLSTDITERKQAEETLRESEQSYHRQFANNSVMMMLIDAADGRIIEANAAALGFFGYPRDVLLAMHVTDLNTLPSADVQQAMASVQQEKGELFQFQYRLADGSLRDVEVSLSRIQLGKRIVLHSIVIDITERKRAEEAARWSEARLRGITDSAQDAIIMMDPHGAISYWNPAAESILGYRAEEALGKHLHQMLVPERYVGAHRAAFPEFLRTGRGAAVGKTLELQALRKDGQEIAIDLSLSAVSLKGEWHAVGILRNITERKQAETAQRQSEAEFRALFETVNDGIFILDAEDATILKMNEVAGRRLGYSQEELLGLPVWRIDASQDDEHVRHLIGELSKRDEVLFETTQVRKDGSFVPVEINCRQMEFRGRRAAVCAVREITERKEAETAMRGAMEAADAANLAKSRFLANMSHEIRTPMNGVLGMLQLLAKTTLSPAQQRYAAVAQNSGWNLLRLIDDILDLSKIEAGKIALENLSFDLRDTIHEVVQLMQVKASAKGVDIKWQLSSEIPSLLRGDAYRLRQVLTNLIGNAVKFTKRGEIKVGATLDTLCDSRATIRFAVNDTGIGIRPDQLAALFSPFMQADSSTTRKYGGTGLGLAICKHLVELMGGSIGVDSKQGQGSAFWFTVILDLAPGDQQLPASDKPGIRQGASVQPIAAKHAGRILVAEDDLTNREVALAQLQKLGHRSSAVTNGAEAVEALRNGNFDLVLMDCQMPVMDGFEATHRIRKSLRPGIPIIAVTAGAMSDDRDRCLREGMNDYLAKPVELGLLAEMLAKWLPIPVAGEESVAREPVDAGELLPR